MTEIDFDVKTLDPTKVLADQDGGDNTAYIDPQTGVVSTKKLAKDYAPNGGRVVMTEVPEIAWGEAINPDTQEQLQENDMGGDGLYTQIITDNSLENHSQAEAKAKAALALLSVQQGSIKFSTFEQVDVLDIVPYSYEADDVNLNWPVVEIEIGIADGKLLRQCTLQNAQQMTPAQLAITSFKLVTNPGQVRNVKYQPDPEDE